MTGFLWCVLTTLTFESPPWGGVEYRDPSKLKGIIPTNKKYVNAYPFAALQPVGGKKLLELTFLICDKLVMFVPRNMDLTDVADAVNEVEYGTMVHVEEMWMGQRLKALSLFFEKQGMKNKPEVP